LWVRVRPEAGNELYKVTRDGTVTQVADIYPGSGGSFPLAFGSAEYYGELYFTARGPEHGTELYKMAWNGAITQVADIYPGSGDSNPSGFTEYRGELYFSAFEPEHGTGLYKVTQDGTVNCHTDWFFA
jgi:ELWxxDGT repeat protein